MRLLRPASLLMALWIATVAAYGGCALFRPAVPPNPTKVLPSVRPIYTTPANTLNTIKLAIENKATSNGHEAYVGAFADTANGREFHAFFDPLTLNRFPAGTAPSDWNHVFEADFYDRFVRLYSGRYLFTWESDDPSGSDIVDDGNGTALLHRHYLMSVVDEQNYGVTICDGFAELEFVRLQDQWVIVRWQDRENPDADRSKNELCLGEWRLNSQ